MVTAGGRRKVAGLAVTVTAIAVGMYAIRGQLPSPASVLDVLGGADPIWLGVALLATAVAVVAFSWVQRRLVVDLGGELSRWRSVELTLTSGAISMALPAGSALGAGYTYRRLRRTGLSSADAGVGMVGSAGLLSVTLVAAYLALTGPALFDRLVAELGAIVGTALVLLTVVVIVVGARRVRTVRTGIGNRTHGVASADRMPVTAVPERRFEVRRDRIAGTVRAGIGRLRSYVGALRLTAASLPAATWRSGAGWALVKWVADFAVLAGAVLAVGAGVDFIAVASVYVGVQILRQIPITPGGVGVIEAALLAGLIAAGAAAAPAAAAVVIYRGLTFWLTLAAGAIAAVAFRVPAGVGVIEPVGTAPINAAPINAAPINAAPRSTPHPSTPHRSTPHRSTLHRSKRSPPTARYWWSRRPDVAPRFGRRDRGRQRLRCDSLPTCSSRSSTTVRRYGSAPDSTTAAAMSRNLLLVFWEATVRSLKACSAVRW